MAFEENLEITPLLLGTRRICEPNSNSFYIGGHNRMDNLFNWTNSNNIYYELKQFIGSQIMN